MAPAPRPLYVLPLLFALSLCVPVLLAPYSERVDLVLSRIALPVFGSYVVRDGPKRNRQLARMRAAHVDQTHRVYAARTLLFGAIFAIVASVLGIYFAGALVLVLNVDVSSIHITLYPPFTFLTVLSKVPGLALLKLFGLLLASASTVGVATAAATYWLRWQYLDQRARARAGEIDATLPRTVAFIYALSRSGMPFPRVLETLSRNRQLYGEAAREVSVAVREMNAFGTDVLTALRKMSSRTPSSGLKEFGENLVSALGGSRDLSAFLDQQHQRYQSEVEAYQEQYLELIEAFAEIYVTVLVAGPLFLVTILVIIGLVIEDTLPMLRFVGYVGIPLGSAGFVVYLDSVTRSDGIATRADDEDPGGPLLGGTPATENPPVATPDGGRVAVASPSQDERRNRERLAVYDRLCRLKRLANDPLTALFEHPAATLLVTLPLGAFWVWLRVRTVPRTPGAFVTAVDGPVAEAAVVVLGAVAVVYELDKHRTRELEMAVPDFLERMASVNEAGLTVVESIDRVAGSDLGRLGTELERVRRDIEFGADVQTALRRMERRTRTAMISRAVTLVTNAMAASGDIAPVLRIAADEAQDTRRLREERRRTMLTYLVVIYISFFVFLGILVALTVSFIPAIEQTGAQLAADTGGAAAVSPGPLSGLGSVNTAAYERFFFRMALVQGVCSGFVAGQLGEGRPIDGLKHATGLLVVAYATFLLI